MQFRIEWRNDESTCEIHSNFCTAVFSESRILFGVWCHKKNAINFKYFLRKKWNFADKRIIKGTFELIFKSLNIILKWIRKKKYRGVIAGPISPNLPISRKNTYAISRFSDKFLQPPIWPKKPISPKLRERFY